MSKKAKPAIKVDNGLISVKSQFEDEFRRFSVNSLSPPTFTEFIQLVEQFHKLFQSTEQRLKHQQNELDSSAGSDHVFLFYLDPQRDLLPITNDSNLKRAIMSAQFLLRIMVVKDKNQPTVIRQPLTLRSISSQSRNYLACLVPGAMRSSRLTAGGTLVADQREEPRIGSPKNFRRISTIIDVDIIPETQRRVKFIRDPSCIGRPLGFYIRDGLSIRVTPQGLEKVMGTFVSRMVSGGLAQSTGLLSVGDEILEVNGIEVVGKTLDQVTDMMVANSSNLIVTIKPLNQKNNVTRNRRTCQERNSCTQNSSDASNRTSCVWEGAAASSGKSLNDSVFGTDRATSRRGKADGGSACVRNRLLSDSYAMQPGTSHNTLPDDHENNRRSTSRNAREKSSAYDIATFSHGEDMIFTFPLPRKSGISHYSTDPCPNDCGTKRPNSSGGRDKLASIGKGNVIFDRSQTLEFPAVNRRASPRDLKRNKLQQATGTPPTFPSFPNTFSFSTKKQTTPLKDILADREYSGYKIRKTENHPHEDHGTNFRRGSIV